MLYIYDVMDKLEQNKKLSIVTEQNDNNKILKIYSKQIPILLIKWDYDIKSNDNKDNMISMDYVIYHDNWFNSDYVRKFNSNDDVSYILNDINMWIEKHIKINEDFYDWCLSQDYELNYYINTIV